MLNLPDDGLWSAGLKVSLGKGLLIDERRASLKKAKVFQEQNTNRQVQVLNSLYRDASFAYWNWTSTYFEVMVSQEAYDISYDRFLQTKQSFIQGDKPAIDTLENFIQVQNRELNLQQAKQNYQSAQYYLNTFLWGENNTPLEI